jgi:hypothetical protein
VGGVGLWDQVGNSGILINGSHGPAIDGHAAVWRFNLALTRGHERDVGERTTLQMMNAPRFNHCALLARKPAVPDGLVWHCSTPRRCDCLLPNGRDLAVLVRQPAAHALTLRVVRERHPSTPFVQLGSMHHLLCHAVVRQYAELRLQAPGPASRRVGSLDVRATSGLQAVVMALAMCEKVSEQPTHTSRR